MKKNSKGQAILFAVVGVTIALAIGVTAASRNLSSISRVSRTDTSSRAYAAAEGGLERLLLLNDSQLELLANGVTQEDCTSVGFTGINGEYCTLAYPPVSGEVITSLAELKVEKYRYTNDTESYFRMSLSNGDTKEVVLTTATEQYPNSTIDICWDGDDTAIYYYSYNPSGNIAKGGLIPYSGLATHSSDVSNYGFVNAATGDAAHDNFDNCGIVNLVTTPTPPYGLRIKALFGAANVGIFPVNQLPYQGYKLTSNGKIQQQSEVKETKQVILYRSLPYMPSFFDAAIFSNTGTIN